VFKSLYLRAALAAGLPVAGAMQPAAATPSAPVVLAQPAAQSALVENTAWRCDPRRCWWVPGYRGPLPGFARRWGTPEAPGCHLKRGPLGRWKYKCDFD
jgi:hypothetical protein